MRPWLAATFFGLSTLIAKLRTDVWKKFRARLPIRVQSAVVSAFNFPVAIEDAEFYRKLRRRGRTRQLSSTIITSVRRYEEIGPYRLTASYLLLAARAQIFREFSGAEQKSA